MSKRKELILKAIYAHTLECLEDKQYDKAWNGCLLFGDGFAA